MMMTGIAVIGLIYRMGKKFLRLGWDSFAIVSAYLFTTWLLYASR